MINCSHILLLANDLFTEDKQILKTMFQLQSCANLNYKNAQLQNYKVVQNNYKVAQNKYSCILQFLKNIHCEGACEVL